MQYDTTPEQLDAFCEGIRELIRQHPNTRKDYFLVHFNDFGANSLDILLYFFVNCPSWEIELRDRQRILTDIMRLANELGVKFAFPSRTVHLFTEPSASEPVSIDAPSEMGRELAAKIAASKP